MILAFETATNVCSVAICNKEGHFFERRTEERGSHSEQLFLFLEELMKEHHFDISDIEEMLVSEGPGSYTGLRIGASAVKGLLFHQKVPLFGISTLASFAMQAAENTATSQTIHSIIDARRKHFYYQPFICKNGKLIAMDEAQIILIKDFELRVNKKDIVIGTGFDRMEKKVRKEVNSLGVSWITAKSLIRIYQKQSEFLHEVEAENFSPNYYTSNQG